MPTYKNKNTGDAVNTYENANANYQPTQYANPLTSASIQTNSAKNEYGEIINPTEQDVANFNAAYTTYKPNELSSANLSNPNNSNLKSYNEPPVYDVSSLLSMQPMQMTEPEQKVSSYTDKLTELNSMLEGKSIYRSGLAEQNGLIQSGVDDKGNPTYTSQQESELNDQLNALTNEAKYIPLQLQNDATGRGITAGGLAPIQTGKLRENAIKSLQVSSLISAQKNKMALAEMRINEAVRQKYGAVEERIKTLTDNLKLIKDSPEYSVADKNRANQQLMLQEYQKAQLEKQKEDYKKILDTAAEAAKNGADALTLQKIQNAKTPLEAIGYASPFMAVETQMKQNEQVIKQKELEEKIKQQAFDNNVKLEDLKLKREQFASDKEYKDAELQLSYMKLQEGDKLSISDKINLAKGGYSLDETGNIVKTGLTATEQKEKDKLKAAQSSARTEATNKIQLIDKLLNNSGINAAVGTNALSRSKILNPLDSYINGKRQDFISQTQQLISQETLNTLLNLKKGGGTLGALSDQERLMLQNAASAIGGWAIRDKNGNVTGYNTSEKSFKEELNRIKDLAKKALNQAGKYGSVEDYLNEATPEQMDNLKTLQEQYPEMEEDDLIELLNSQSFNMVGSDTNKALSIKDGNNGGQCGRFVNQHTGLGLGDSYSSKMSKMDKSIKTPEPGMVFVMPYKNTGHTGFILSVNNDGTATVKDSNWGLDKKVRTHKIALNKMTGFARV